MNLLINIIILIFLLLPLSATAETGAESTAATESRISPCEQHDRFREFDFWVGEWNVHDGKGTLVGENAITSEESGCLLVERWHGVQGSSGMSINYLDKITDEWVQIWHAAGGYQIDIRGGLTDNGMLLRGTIHYIGTGQTAPFRGLWTPLPDGRVRQFFEQSNDDGATWEPWFEGFYTRQSAD
jgi:hypothetical protein